MHSLLLAVLLAETSYETVGSNELSPSVSGAYYHATAAGTVEYLNFSVETAGTGFFTYDVYDAFTGAVVCSSGALAINCGAVVEGSSICTGATLTAGSSYRLRSTGCSGGNIYVGMQVSHTGTAYETFDAHIPSSGVTGAVYRAKDAATVEHITYVADATALGTATLTLRDLTSSTNVCTGAAACNTLSRKSIGFATCSGALTAGHDYEIQRSGCLVDVYAGVQLSRPTTSTTYDTAGALIDVGSLDGVYYQTPTATVLDDITYHNEVAGTGTYALRVYDWSTFSVICSATGLSCSSTGMGTTACSVSVPSGHLLEMQKSSGCTGGSTYAGMRFDY